MLKTVRNRRGVTLAEIMVALALVSIMITMVVSFAMLISERTQANAQNDAMRRDGELVRTGAERWLDAVTLAGGSVTASGNQVTAGEATLSYQYGSLRGVLPGGESFTLRTESVTSVAFEVKTNGTDALLFCFVTCEDPEADTPAVFTICVNARVGESGGGS